MKRYQNLDPVIRQLKSWHKYKTKPAKADTSILGNKTLIRYFRNFNKTSVNENTDLLEYQLDDSKVPCLPLSMILIAFNITHTRNTKGHSGSEKTYSNFTQILISKRSNMDKSIMQGLYNMSTKKTLSKSKTNSTKTRF